MQQALLPSGNVASSGEKYCAVVCAAERNGTLGSARLVRLCYFCDMCKIGTQGVHQGDFMTRIFLKHFGLRQAVALSAASFLSLAGVATAQTTTTAAGTEATRGGLEEVVVTATRRAENLQEVPIAVTAFTAEQLQSKGVTDIQALSNLTPNVNLDGGAPFSGDSSVLSASIRGIGQDDFAFNLDPGVGVYIDGAYLARTIGANQNLLDVDRIEILKGPQGTLFGRNTIGGAINIVTHTPGTEFTVKGAITEGQYNRHDVSVTADMPISTALLSSISVSSQNRDGYQTTIPFPATAPYQVLGQEAVPKAPGLPFLEYPGRRGLAEHSRQVALACQRQLRCDPVGRLHQSAAVGHSEHDPRRVPGQRSNLCARERHRYPAAVHREHHGQPVQRLYHHVSRRSRTWPPLGTVQQRERLVRADGRRHLEFADELIPRQWRRLPRCAGAGWQRRGERSDQRAQFAPGQLPTQYVHIAPGASVGSLLFPGQTPRIYWDFANTQTGNKDLTYGSGPSFANNDAYGGSLTLDWRFSPDMELKSISAWREISWNIGTDLDGLPESMQEVTDGQGQRQVSQEFQLLGKAMDNKLNYVAGVYYFNESGYVHDYVPFDTGYLYVYDYDNNIKTDSYAGYLHADYKLTNAWGLTAGVRYSHEKKQFLGGQGDLNGFSYKISGCLDPSADANTFFGFGAVPNGVTCQQVLGFPDPNNPLRYFPNQWDSRPGACGRRLTESSTTSRPT